MLAITEGVAVATITTIGVITVAVLSAITAVLTSRTKRSADTAAAELRTNGGATTRDAIDRHAAKLDLHDIKLDELAQGQREILRLLVDISSDRPANR